MKFNDIKNSFFEENFKVIYLNKKINIVNYKKIEHFDSNKIEISYNNGLIKILGNKLVIKKLLKDELLINGLIEKLEFR
ncbi:MAG TPA: YabP/YqfC family sporulation protein [Bacilli bacterium]|nr:YabP/YqfC family sporulation protein [Bacilli bacterium]